jgi:hypothetical protein
VDIESDKNLWVDAFPVGEPDRDILGRLIDVDNDEAETEYYEWYADPTYVAIESGRYRGMFRRRLRHLRGSSAKS